jgi:hypothetical protein
MGIWKKSGIGFALLWESGEWVVVLRVGGAVEKSWDSSHAGIGSGAGKVVSDASWRNVRSRFAVVGEKAGWFMYVGWLVGRLGPGYGLRGTT